MASDLHYCLLSHPVFSVQLTTGSPKSLSLPEVFVSLSEDHLISFEALRKHQEQPLHAFLVQLATLALCKGGLSSLNSSAEAWADALTQLTAGKDGAWCLVNSDLAQPAFMQTPIPEGSLEDANYKSDIETPDELDVLVTSKNHDVKGTRMRHPSPEHWAFALLTLQTMEGYSGSRNYGVVRMNKGHGNRPMVGVTSSLTWGGHFARDVEALMTARPVMEKRYTADGPGLLWTLPWDGEKNSTFPLASCDPYFIEVCRRIRFVSLGVEGRTSIECFRATTKATRIQAPKDLNGRTGDPWTPTHKADEKALTVGESGFTYELLQRIFLSGDYQQPIALDFLPSEKTGAFLIARTLVRGQSKTDGLHHRVIPVSAKVISLFKTPGQKEMMGKRALARVQKAKEVQQKVLYPALASLLSGGKEDKVDSKELGRWIRAFNSEVDRVFFNLLWSSVSIDEEASRRDWQEALLNIVETLFRRAEQGVPIPSSHYWKARSKARSVFEAGVKKVLPHATSEEQSTTLTK